MPGLFAGPGAVRGTGRVNQAEEVGELVPAAMMRRADEQWNVISPRSQLGGEFAALRRVG